MSGKVMETRKYFLDTNIIIDLFKYQQQTVNKLSEIKHLNISVVVLGELIYGAEKSTNRNKHLKQITAFSKTVSIVPINKSTSVIYGKIKTQLKKIGKPIPENDIWISAQAIEHQAVLFTNDRHFKNILDLVTENIKQKN